jgi:3-isopropylmalate/(R)-2-methylmalate dehydratase small subunit
MKFTARVWKFPDNINTDLILPNRAFYLTPEEQVKFVFSANRPGWVDRVQPGDILIGGRNFGRRRACCVTRLGCLSRNRGLFSATA